MCLQVTHSVAILARWMAADLHLREVDALRFELSQNHASDEVGHLSLFIPSHICCSGLAISMCEQDDN